MSQKNKLTLAQWANRPQLIKTRKDREDLFESLRAKVIKLVNNGFRGEVKEILEEEFKAGKLTDLMDNYEALKRFEGRIAPLLSAF